MSDAKQARELVKRLTRRCPCCGGAVILSISCDASLESLTHRFVGRVSAGEITYELEQAEDVEEQLRERGFDILPGGSGVRAKP